jgi:hypothetical protein
MAMWSPDAATEPLLVHLERTAGLSRGESVRVVQDVVGWFTESPDAFVRRRHRELQRSGVANEAAFVAIVQELEGRPVPGPRLTTRQVRRIIYS